MKHRKYFRKHIGTALRRIRDRNGAMAFLVEIIQLFIRIFLYLQDVSRSLQINLSGFRRHHAVLPTFKQLHSELFLQLQQLLIQRRLREKQALCSPGNTSLACDRQDIFDLLQFHISTLLSTAVS